MARLLLLLIFMVLPAPCYADEVTLRVKAIKYQSTPYLRNCVDDCISLDSWHVYTVKVKEVVSGEFVSKKIKVAVLEHARRKLWSRKNWKIVIEEFSNQNNIEIFGTKYFVVRQSNDT